MDFISNIVEEKETKADFNVGYKVQEILEADSRSNREKKGIDIID